MAYPHTSVRRREETESTVLIASENVLETWSSSTASPTDLLALADDDAQQALAVIRLRRPQVVILEQIFAASDRGASLVDHLCSNEELAGLDIRILPAERSAVLEASGPIAGRLLASVARSLQRCPIRRARRLAMPIGSEMIVDGSPAALINVSALGAQVVSPTILRPNQTIEAVIDEGRISLRTEAEIAWSNLELAAGGLTYRAGMAFANAQPELLRFDALR